MDSKTNISKVYLEIEQKIINLMLQHKDVIGEMVDSGVGVDFFDSRHRPLVQSIYYTYSVSDGKRLLTDDHFRSLLLERGGKGDITIAMQVYHECRYGVHFSNTKENFDLLKKQLVNSFVRLDKKINNKEEIVLCKIPEIDEAMNVGFKPGHTTLIVGATGGHKTNLMLNIALQVYEQGKNVLFLPLEMDWEDFVTRIISNVASVSYGHLLNPAQLTKEEYKRAKEARAWISKTNKFSLLDVDEQITVPFLQRELEKRRNHFAPDLVVVDYLGLLKTQSNFGQRYDLALGDLTKSMKFLGKKYAFHTLTAAQLGRADIKRLREEGPGARLDSTSVKGSQEVSADVEFIFALSAIPDEDDRLKFHNIKSRYGPSGYTNDLRLDADKCQISSMKPPLVSGGVGSDIFEDEDFLKSEEQISKEIEDSSPIQFVGMDPDDLDTL